MNDSCKSDSIPTALVSKITSAVIELHNETKNAAVEKVRQIMDIGST
jgi:hypothetical protein